jgi:hypothetical protein
MTVVADAKLIEIATERRPREHSLECMPPRPSWRRGSPWGRRRGVLETCGTSNPTQVFAGVRAAHAACRQKCFVRADFTRLPNELRSVRGRGKCLASTSSRSTREARCAPVRLAGGANRREFTDPQPSVSSQQRTRRNGRPSRRSGLRQPLASPLAVSKLPRGGSAPTSCPGQLAPLAEPNARTWLQRGGLVGSQSEVVPARNRGGSSPGHSAIDPSASPASQCSRTIELVWDEPGLGVPPPTLLSAETSRKQRRVADSGDPERCTLLLLSGNASSRLGECFPVKLSEALHDEKASLRCVRSTLSSSPIGGKSNSPLEGRRIGRACDFLPWLAHPRHVSARASVLAA